MKSRLLLSILYYYIITINIKFIHKIPLIKKQRKEMKKIEILYRIIETDCDSNSRSSSHFARSSNAQERFSRS